MKDIVFAIDPGTTESGYVIWDGKKILDAGKVTNGWLMAELERFGCKKWLNSHNYHAAIEQIRSYGQPVGQEVFDTCVWCGRFAERLWNAGNIEPEFVPRIEVKKHLCHRHIAKDAEIRRVLIDRFGDKPTKKKPNPVYGEFKLKADEWQAFALAVTYYDININT